nr:membrane protein [Actinoplanes derwentensis]
MSRTESHRSGVTARGFGLILATIVLVGAGFRYGYPDLALLGAAAGIAVLAALVFAFWRPRLGVTRIADPDRVARGEPAHVTLTISNTSRVRAATLIATDRCGTATVDVPLLRLRAGNDTVESYPVPTHRRGLVPIGPLHVTRRDPLGLITLARGYGETTVVRVYPRVHPLRALPAGLTRSLDGSVDKVPQGTITFDTLREYVPGDEIRRIHWRSSAKVGELMVREQLDTAEPTIVVLLDDRASAHHGDSFEDACEAAASIVVAAVREDLPVSLHLVTTRISGPHLDVLTEAALGDGDLDATLRQLRAQRLGDTLIFLTGPGGRADLGAVSGLRSAYPVALAGILGDRDSSPSAPTDRLLVIEAVDGAEFAAAWDGTRGW